MYPTFIPGDVLYIKECKEKEIKKGDIIVFKTGENEKNIVHRVVSIDNSGIRTRGDNNSNIDNSVLTQKDIQGKVLNFERQGKKYPVSGGQTGLIKANFIRLMRRANRKILNIFRPFYRLILQFSFLKILFSGKKTFRVLSFKKPEGTEKQLMAGSYVIGRLRPGYKRWHIKVPFRLFIDEKSLPLAEETHEN